MLIKVDFSSGDLKKQLDSLEKKDIPFAIARALTWTAQDAQKAMKEEIKGSFHRPTKFTLNSVYIKPARKDNLQAEVLLKDQYAVSKGTPASKFLNAEIEGGQRGDKSHERQLRNAGLLPAGMQATSAKKRRDGAGNMPGSLYTLVLSRVGGMSYFPSANAQKGRTAYNKKKNKHQATGTFFIGKAGKLGLLGVWERLPLITGKSTVRPWLIFINRPKYEKRLDWEYVVAKTTEKTFEGNFERSVKMIRSDLFWGS